MSFPPHYNKLQLKRRVPQGTCHEYWDFAFHANLLICTQEIYLRTKRKNEILKPLSQGSIWKANGANVRSTRFHTSASSSGGPWDGSSWQWQERGSMAAELQACALFSALFSMASHDGPIPRGEATLQSAFPFLFPVRLWRPFITNKAVFSDAGYLRTKTVYYQNRRHVTLLPEGLE